MNTRMMISIAVAAALTLAACGDDDDAASEATEAPETTAASLTTEAAGSTTIVADDPYCALVQELFDQDSPPTAAQLTKYQEVAPAEITDAVAIAAPPLIEAGEDMVAFFNAVAVDEVEEAIAEIDAFENETCGVEHDVPTTSAGVSSEVEDGAERVDVVATDFAFDIPAIESGRTSFVLTNDGAETHFLLIIKLAEGVTLAEAMENEDDSMVEAEWETGLAAPGGEDEEVVTFDVEPGNYGALCFISGPDGTPHAFMGMQQEFTVS